MEAISGVIERLSPPYQGGWRIAKVPPHGAVVGMLGEGLQRGDCCTFRGQWKQHPKYGQQFEAASFVVEVPRDTLGIMDYLVRHFKWIGPTTSRALVDSFGDRLFDVMENSPEDLAKVQGITASRAQDIHKEYIAVKEDRQHDVWFSTHGITPGAKNRLVDNYGSKAKVIEAILENPYRLAEEVWGVGFKKADQIALSIGIKEDSKRRCNAGVKWVLEEASSDGHCYLPHEELLLRCVEVLRADQTRIKEAIKDGIEQKKLIRTDEGIYLAGIHQAEMLVSRKLAGMLAKHHEVMMSELTPSEIAEMDPDQKRALDLALGSRVCVITGGPGVGKTWTVRKIIEAIGGNRSIELAAPTGKAAKRMSEMSSRDARTIHRLLEFHPVEGFRRNGDNPLDCDTLIIDEVSMIDVRLMASLMDAIGSRTQVIFVGDKDQLPSVGPGKVLSDMIASGIAPVAHLKTLHRQAAKSYININARNVNSGQKIVINDESKDFYFIQELEDHKIPAIIAKTIERIPEKFKIPLEDVQVICPQKRGNVGTENLNRVLREVYNPGGRKVSGTVFCEGDRVIQTRNNYNLEVFNGDIGRVVGGNRDDLFVAYKDMRGTENIVKYPIMDTSELQPAYALTIHKSQGSEFGAVIIPIHTTNYIMLRRNLLYTAITRGRQLVVLVGSHKAASLAVKTIDASQRYTGLIKRIMEQTGRANG